LSTIQKSGAPACRQAGLQSDDNLLAAILKYLGLTVGTTMIPRRQVEQTDRTDIIFAILLFCFIIYF